MEGGLDLSNGSSKDQGKISDEPSCENTLWSDVSDTSSETYESEAQDSYDSDGYSKDPLSNDVASYKHLERILIK